MTQFTFFVKLLDTKPNHLSELTSSLLAQVVSDWELILLVEKGQKEDLRLAKQLIIQDSRFSFEMVAPGDLPAWACNDMLSVLGEWIGFLDATAKLEAGTLSQIQQDLLSKPEVQLIYTDEETRNNWGDISLRFTKQALDSTRLVYQEYLRDLVLIRKTWLETNSGFDRLASDKPMHDAALRILSSFGSVGFLGIPSSLYIRRRASKKVNVLPQHRSHMVDYDLYAVRQYLLRQGVPAEVRQFNGTLDIRHRYSNHPSVSLVLTLDDDLRLGVSALMALRAFPQYPGLTVRVLYYGNSESNWSSYRILTAGQKIPSRWIKGDLPAALNQEALLSPGVYLAFLRGCPVNPFWLHKLVDQLRQPNVEAVSARIITPVRFTQPGTIGYKYDGWDWNSRGHFNQLTVPHEMSALSPAGLLIKRQRFLDEEGFSSNYLNLYGMAYTMRLSLEGYLCVFNPDSQVESTGWHVPTLEADALRLEFPGWVDPYGIHSL